MSETKCLEKKSQRKHLGKTSRYVKRRTKQISQRIVFLWFSKTLKQNKDREIKVLKLAENLGEVGKIDS